MKNLIIALIVMVGSSAFAGESKYTSVDVKDCKTIEASWLLEEPEIDYYTGHCKGMAGFKVEISGGDIRYDLKLIYKGTRIDDLVSLGSFRDMGSDKIEWRFGLNKNNKKVAKALIFRINAMSGYDEESGMPVNEDYLHVVKLKGKQSCTVRVINNHPNMNEYAREIADSIDNYDCLKDIL